MPHLTGAVTIAKVRSVFVAAKSYQRRTWRPLAVLVMLATLLAQPLLAAASAGWVEDSRCCCPEPAECHCPGHDPRDEQEGLRKCGNTGELVPPATLALSSPPAPPVLGVVQVAEVRSPPPPALETQASSRPETPPF